MQFTVHFSTEEDALHGAALVIRGGQHPWLKLFKRSAAERS
jgi:hypothetical protein